MSFTVKVFDVLYIKNKDGLVVSMLGDAPYPLKERKRILPQIFRQKQGVLEIADLVKASTARHISDYLKRIVETRLVRFLLLLTWLRIHSDIVLISIAEKVLW